MAGEAKRQSKEEKAEARKARNEAQAIEERTIWAQIEKEANLAAITQKPRISYSEDLANEMIIRMSAGQSLNSICKLEHMPHISTVFDWIEKDPSFAEKYGRARELAAHSLFDSMICIADDESKDLLADGSANNAAIARARLRIETRARVAGKLAPKVYGERIEQLAQTVNVTNNNLTIDAASLGADQRAALRAMLTQAKEGKVIDG